MHVRCPHCHDPIEIVAADPLADISCPSCGSHFNLLSGETASCSAGPLKSIGHFELLESVGGGHFGTVWKARDTQLDRFVAIKIPRKGQLEGAEAEMFIRDARAAAQVKHPGVVSVHEVGRQYDVLYIVSDFINGCSLKHWLSGRQYSPREAAELCVKIARALHAAHEAGVVHRDLKPGNVMMDLAGEPHLIDFGLAKREAGEVTMTIDGQVLGTPAYMSPEQARGEAHTADRRSDVYSLGVILFELLTGEVPFRGSQRMMIVQILQDEPPSPRRLQSRIPRDLETICLKCLEKDPAKRFATAEELAEELERFLNGEPLRSRRVGSIGRAWRWYRHHPDAMMLVAGGFSVICALLFVLWGLAGVAIFLAGLLPTSRPHESAVTIVVLIFVLYLPILAAGIKTLNGSAFGLYAGIAGWLAGLAISWAGLAGKLFDVEAFGDTKARLPLFALFIDLSILALLLHALAAASRARPVTLRRRSPAVDWHCQETRRNWR